MPYGNESTPEKSLARRRSFLKNEPIEQAIFRRCMMLAHESKPLALQGVKRWHVTVAGTLRITSGQVWLTRDGDPDDHVLAAGEWLRLRAGDTVTAEPWHHGHSVQLSWEPVRAPQPQARGFWAGEWAKKKVAA
jgi:Protein of unknown function (DUF2917)